MRKSNIIVVLLSIIFILSMNPIYAYADENTMDIYVDIVWKDSNNIHDTRPDGIEMKLKVDNDKVYGSGTINVYDTSFIFEDVSKGDDTGEYNYDLEVLGVSSNVYDCDIVKYGDNRFVVVYTLKVKNGNNGEIIMNDNNYLSQGDQNRTSDDVVENDFNGTEELDDTPKTSDEFNYGLYLTVAIVAFVAMISIGIYCLIRKKEIINDVEEFKYVVNGDETSGGVTLTKDEDGIATDKGSVSYTNKDNE